LAYPTETVYGFGGAIDERSVQQLVNLKGRPQGKPFLLLVAATSLFGQLPGAAGQVAQRLAGGTALQAGLLLPLFFMSFALLESIKSSIGIWWEKAQGSLEVLLYTPVDDPSLIWLEVLPGAVVSTVWVTFWMGAGMAFLSLFGQPAPWDLLPIFAFVAAVTAYWAAMGRMLGFMLFPREGAAGGAWSFLLSPVSAAVADLPLALFHDFEQGCVRACIEHRNRRAAANNLIGEELCADLAGRREHDGPFDNVFQLADVARPRVVHHRTQRLGCDTP